MMVDSGAGVAACRRHSVRSLADQPDSLSLVLEAIALSTSARRPSGTPREMVPMLRSRSEPRESKTALLSVDSVIWKGQVAVFTDSGGFIIPMSALQVDPPVRKLSLKRQNGHFWLPLARRVETSVSPVMVPSMEGAAEGGRMPTRRWTRSCPGEPTLRLVQNVRPGSPAHRQSGG